MLKGPVIRMTLLYILFAVLESGAAAQATASSAFSLGATMDDTYKVFGPPTQWYVWTSAAVPGRFLNSSAERDAALQVYGVWAVNDVYMRQTSTNQYRIKVGWGADKTSSRLHPTMRVGQIQMDVDKPAPAIVILGDLPEAAEICKAGCALYGEPDGCPGVLASCVLAFPPQPSEFHVGVMLALKKGGGLYGGGELPDWKSGIVSITIGLASAPTLAPDPPPLKKGQKPPERRLGDPIPPVKIGMWMPESR